MVTVSLSLIAFSKSSRNGEKSLMKSERFLSSILIFTSKKTKLNKQKNEEILAIKQNIETVREMDGQINILLQETMQIRTGLNELVKKTFSLYNMDYNSLEPDQKQLLGTLINNTKALSAMFGRTIGE